MTGHLIFACQLSWPKKRFFVGDTLLALMSGNVSFMLNLCKGNCHVLNVMHLKRFMAELPSFKCDTFEMQKCRVTESYVLSVTLVMSAVGSVGRGNDPVWRPKWGHQPGGPADR